MLRALLACTLALATSVDVFGQELSSSENIGNKTAAFQDTIAAYFNEIRIATAEYKDLWNYDLDGPVLLVQPVTRELYANVADSAGVLKGNGTIYRGILPKEVNIANTSVRWNGVEWAMIMLPLPANKNERACLVTHELFHRAQPALGFKLYNTANSHLDQQEGRILLRLELEALKAAVLAESSTARRSHLRNAFTMREYRRSLFAGADTTENLLELNEGLAEFTGLMMSGMKREEIQDHFRQSISAFLNNPTFVRSFPYQTIPMYGYLLSNEKSTWNREITAQSNLTDYLAKAFNLNLPGDLKTAVAAIAGQYGGETVTAEETAREENRKKLIAEYKYKFIDQPHLVIVFEKMNISFDPRNIIPLGDQGMVYPTIRVTDNWGILTVERGALLGANWDKITVSTPLDINDSKVTGDGWTLELKNGYAVEKVASTSNYTVRKK
ncbi:MAG: hypothetical protein Q8P51_14990 [Ignavibacteria bacterium]|nr:hypothetical protein [Ignavibacteria bacterium]